MLSNKKHTKQKQLIIIIIVFSVMILWVYLFVTDKILSQKDTMKMIEKGMINKLK